MFKRTGNGTIDSIVSDDIIKMLMPKGLGSRVFPTINFRRLLAGFCVND